MRRRKNKKIIIVILILFISIGFAYLSASLNITGLATIKRSVWDVHFENIVNENEDVLNIDTPAVISNNKLRVDFEVSLDQPGQEYSFYVDVLNNSTFDVMVDNVSLTGLTAEQEEWIKPLVTYRDGMKLQKYDRLQENTKETLRVSVKYNGDLTETTLPTTNNDFTVTCIITYKQADENAKARNKIEFINRANKNTLTAGDEIAIGTEHFYVIRTVDNMTSLFAKYNLNIGSNTKEGELGIQNELGGGTVKFSNTTYWLKESETIYNKYYKYPNDHYDGKYDIYDESYNEPTGDNYSIAYHINNYLDKLDEIGIAKENINGRIIGYTEYYILDNLNMDEVPNNGQKYWTSTPRSVQKNGIWIQSSTVLLYDTYFYSDRYGVRPVIEIPTAFLNGDIIVKFDANGGKIDTNVKSVNYNETYGDLPTPTRDGYTFLGWNGYNPVSPVIIGKCISSVNGEDQIKNTCGSTDYIEVDFEKNSIYTVSGLTDKLWSFVAYYDENYVPLGRSAGSSRTSLRLNNVYSTTFNEGGPAKYIRITQYEISGATVDPIDIVSEARILLNPGNYALPYEPYYITNDTTVVQDKSHTLKAIWQEN